MRQLDRRLKWFGILRSVLTGHIVATPLFPIQTFEPGDVPPGFSIDFGRSAAISGDTIAIGAPSHPWFNSQDLGAVYVYQLKGPNWVNIGKLVASDAETTAQLGWSVAIDCDVIVAGAPKFENSACVHRQEGVAYVFRRNDAQTPSDPTDDFWIEEAKLSSPTPENGVGMGYSVAVSAGLITLGSDCSDRVEVFRYVKDGWKHEASLLDPSPLISNEFGISHSIRSNRIGVGSPGYDEGRGAVFLFGLKDKSWSLIQSFTLKNPTELDGFGKSVAMSNAWLICGAPFDDLSRPQSNSGSAYAISLTSPGFAEQLLPAQIGSAENFGMAVDVDNDLVAVSNASIYSGSVFHLGSAAPKEIARLATPSTGRVGISVEGNYLIRSTNLFVVRNSRNLLDYSKIQNCYMQVPMNLDCSIYDKDADLINSTFDFEAIISLLGGPQSR